MSESEIHEELEGVPTPGEVLLDKYRVDRILGRGGMGVVVAATHTTLGQPVAIKFLLARAARNPKNIARFTREAQAAARIQSDHVTRVSDIGTLPSGAPYMVMEHLDGQDLAARLRRGPISIPLAVRYLLQACEALAEAHKAGIVHRDLKPGNLFIAKRPDGSERIKVLDFGISKILADPLGGDLESLTRTRALIGSPLYMAPEQMMSAKDVDARADLWALGVILFEMLSGRPPFIGGTLPEICTRILAMPPDSLYELLPTIPPPLEATVMRCLDKDPVTRLPTLVALADALAPFGDADAQRSREIIRRVLGSAAPVVEPAPETVTFAAQLPPTVGMTAPPAVAVAGRTVEPVSQTMNEPVARPSRAGAVIALSMAALGAIAVAVTFVIRKNSDDETTPSAAATVTATSDATTTVAALVAPIESAPAPIASSAKPAAPSPPPSATRPKAPPPPQLPELPPIVLRPPPPPPPPPPARGEDRFKHRK